MQNLDSEIPLRKISLVLRKKTNTGNRVFSLTPDPAAPLTLLPDITFKKHVRRALQHLFFRDEKRDWLRTFLKPAIDVAVRQED